ncbi:carbohydrate binding family 9 domain-containing protein [Candidatus Aminicenantes bacterium AC-334-K16]|nr:carbohydrate binding family 9 domain-containing protein [Candidatus Aminicenantes bacterium AC-334-K16]
MVDKTSIYRLVLLDVLGKKNAFLGAKILSILVVLFYIITGGNISVAVAAQKSSEARVFILPETGPSPIKLDGQLNEPWWAQAPPLGALTMVEPDEGAPPTEETVIRILASAETLYFGIMCYDRRPGKIVSYTMQRDAQLRGEDHIKIVIDPFLNGRTGYVFAVNPNGARYDALIEKEGEGENPQWDGIWEAAAHRSEEGWSVEIALPIKTLRFKEGVDRWRFNVERRLQRRLETDRWTGINRNMKVTHISQGGVLVGLPAFQQGLGLTVRPYSVLSFSQEDPSQPVNTGFEPGLDIMKNFGGSVTGLISINTDFAETEVDTRQVNLTRFPLFFPEKRTFFLEGSDIYNFGLGLTQYREKDLVPFFSRRIGLFQGQSVPLNVAFKATGNIGQWNFGVLDAVMRPVAGLTPRTNLFAARGYRNIWAESKVGFMVTAGDPQGRRNAWLAGVDFIYKTTEFHGNKNLLIGVWGLINQREDLGNDRTAWGFKIDYPNDIWDLSLTFKKIGRDFDPSLGFVRWAGITKTSLGLAYRPRPDWPWLRQIYFELFPSIVTDLKGQALQWRVFTAPLNWHLESGDRIEFNIMPMMERVPYDFPIGQEAVVKAGRYQWIRYRLELDSASKRPLKIKLSWWFGGYFDGHMSQLQPRLVWRPSHRLNLTLEGEWDRGSLPTGNIDIQLARARVDVYLSPNFQILNYLQYDNLTHSLGLNSRLRYTYRSLLDVFLVFNRSWLETNGLFRPLINQVMLKVQYAWRR